MELVQDIDHKSRNRGRCDVDLQFCLFQLLWIILDFAPAEFNLDWIIGLLWLLKSDINYHS